MEAARHLQAGRLSEAIVLCRKILAADKKQPEALVILGLALGRNGETEEAARRFRQATQRAPNRWDVYHDAGVGLRQIGRAKDAVVFLSRAAQLNPTGVEVQLNLGTALEHAGRRDQAIERYQRAASLDPRHARAHAQWASALHAAGRLDEALPLYERASALDPARADVWYGLGHARLTCGEIGEAETALARSVEIDPNQVDAWYSLGIAQAAHGGGHAEAVESFTRALELDPDSGAAHQNLGQALFNIGRIDEAMGHFGRAASLARAEGRQDVELERMARMSLAVAVPGWPAASQQQILEARRDVQALLPPMQAFDPWEGRDRTPGRRLRIGYVSAFFGQDNWMKPVWGLVNHHDREQVEVHLFSDGPLPPESRDDRGAQRRGGYRPHASDRYHDTAGQANDDVARRILEAGVDILVDLNGYSRVERLPLYAYRPAPIIAGWFNMYATTGLDAFDYLIGDGHVAMAEDEVSCSERVVRVSGSYLTFSVDYPVPAVSPPPCLDRGTFTFGSFTSQYKITPDMIATWSEILARCPKGRLLIKNTAMGNEGNRRYMLGQFASHGIEAGRIDLEGGSPHYEFLEAYARIDLALDTFPYNGGTTTTEAIWQGVPVVAWWGDRWAARTSATILREGNLGEWVADDKEGYVRLAVEWGNDPSAPARLSVIRQEMRGRLGKSSVCDVSRFARDMEAVYRRMWTTGGSGRMKEEG